LFGQAVGDYKSIADGNWSILANWQRYDGIGWPTPTAGEGYPGQINTPGRIDINNNVTLDVSLSAIVDPKINDLYINSGSLQLSTFDFSVNGITSISGTILDNSPSGTNLFIGLVYD